MGKLLSGQYGAGVGDNAADEVTAGAHGFVPALTSFVGRAGDAEKVARLLEMYRLVTVTGPGGVGKTRLAGEVARQVAGRFADGVWLVELAAVLDPGLVPVAVMTALGVRQAPGVPAAESLAAGLARRQLLVVLDNCEHVLDAVAALCGVLLPAADEVTVLATSREVTGIAGEARYRLRPLPVPGAGDGTGGDSAAVVLFAERARLVDPDFILDAGTQPVVAGLVARLDGLPLAIELAAARAEALGVGQLLDRLEESFRLLTSRDRASAGRHQSLEATVAWSYRLLDEEEQRVFRRVSLFPGPFTLESASAVAGAGAEAAVLRLVDCSLLTPPRPGPDGRARYLMLETLRAFGRERLASNGEYPETAAAVTGHAVQVAEQAAAGMATSAGEAAAARWLDAEDATLHQALIWALDHDPSAALRMTIALTSWWNTRGRAAEAYALLSAAAAHTAPGADAWGAMQIRLAYAATAISDMPKMLDHYTAACEALARDAPSPALADALAGRANALVNIDRITEGIAEARGALDMARAISYPPGQAFALYSLSLAAYYLGDAETAVQQARQACRIDPATIPGDYARECGLLLAVVLIAAGEVSAARDVSVSTLALARETGDVHAQANGVTLLAELEMLAGSLAEARAHLSEALRLAGRTGDPSRVLDALRIGADLCAASGQWSEMVTIQTAAITYVADHGLTQSERTARRGEELLRKAVHVLGPERTRAAQERGAAMSLDTVTELMLLLAESGLPAAPPADEPPGLAELSARERELVTLVARGRTDSQIAAQLFISVSTVRSHLDRIRDKTGYRRRADLTRLALQTGLA